MTACEKFCRKYLSYLFVHLVRISCGAVENILTTGGFACIHLKEFRHVNTPLGKDHECKLTCSFPCSISSACFDFAARKKSVMRKAIFAPLDAKAASKSARFV
jgi:hypothetical protein